MLFVPLLVAALAAGALIGWVNTGADPVDGLIKARETIDGEIVARIEAPSPYNPDGETIVDEVALPARYRTATTVPVRVLSDWSIEIVETGFRMPQTGLLAIVTGLGALAGLVIVFNARGYGFVRGTGEPGTMQPSDIEEDKGFYWRS